MAEFPALPFFTDAYLADTRHLTTEEHGAYLLLLMCAWRTRGCCLKDNDRLLARIAGVSPTRWRRLKPNLVEFFTVTDGLWQQKKLSYVYDTVAKKVARNRTNGARGGRATAAKHKNTTGHISAEAGAYAQAGFTPGWQLDASEATNSIAASDRRSECYPDAVAMAPAAEPASKTKTKTITKAAVSSSKPSDDVQQQGVECGKTPAESENSHDCDKSAPFQARATAETLPEITGKTPGYSPGSHAEIAAAASLDALSLDEGTLVLWHTAGAEVHSDILPTIHRISDRQFQRTGNRPSHLAYYSKAVLEARDKRMGAAATGKAHADARPGRPPPELFEKTNAGHWRKFLGDPKSRFRGDYLSQNWCVPRGHPDFKAAFLGADPRTNFNPGIPDEIYKTYGPGWGWKMHLAT